MLQTLLGTTGLAGLADQLAGRALDGATLPAPVYPRGLIDRMGAATVAQALGGRAGAALPPR